MNLARKDRPDITEDMLLNHIVYAKFGAMAEGARLESQGLGRINALFHETDKYRSSLLSQLSPRAPTPIKQKYNLMNLLTIYFLFAARQRSATSGVGPPIKQKWIPGQARNDEGVSPRT